MENAGQISVIVEIFSLRLVRGFIVGYDEIVGISPSIVDLVLPEVWSRASRRRLNGVTQGDGLLQSQIM